MPCPSSSTVGLSLKWLHTFVLYLENESWYSSVTEYQDGENSYCEFLGLFPFLQLAIHIAFFGMSRRFETINRRNFISLCSFLL
jgi:hypothetical protein